MSAAGACADASRSPVVAYALSSIFAGGFARMRSWQQRGRAHPVIAGAILLELTAPPLLIAWQRRVRVSARLATKPGTAGLRVVQDS